MGGDALTGFIAIGVLVVFNIAAVAYSYGVMNQKLKDLCRRTKRLEEAVNGKK